ncbi:ricin B lectin domain-containing protein [Mycena maculata]|uniref:Ricin B lectin domain-containing protein n=1 Tax=Mycena maculata TaxID=230809 RepID=A0AAD7MQK1_9AGAR|nr:ricin B lectin domain-containing protein [Mycena maculata]
MFSRNVASFLSLALAANAQLAGQTVFLKTVFTDASCLTATSNADGAAVIIDDCGSNATSLNSWVVPNGQDEVGTIQIFGDKCLDVTNGVDADGTLLQIWTCATGNTSKSLSESSFSFTVDLLEDQMWIPIPDQSITWYNENKCVDLTNGNLTDGNRVQIWDCDDENDNQKWNSFAITTPTSFVISLKKDTSLCVAASANAVGAPVVIDDCSPGSAAQTFSDPTQSGQMVIYDNLCVTPASNDNDGVPLILSPCVTGDAAQDWSHETGLITNGNDPKICLDLTNSDETPGNQLQIWTCTLLTSTTDNTNQDWIVTDTFNWTAGCLISPIHWTIIFTLALHNTFLIRSTGILIHQNN